jgi:hypothetical protein
MTFARPVSEGAWLPHQQPAYKLVKCCTARTTQRAVLYSNKINSSQDRCSCSAAETHSVDELSGSIQLSTNVTTVSTAAAAVDVAVAIALLLCSVPLL